MTEVTVSYLLGVISIFLAFYAAEGAGKPFFIILGLVCFAVSTYAEE